MTFRTTEDQNTAYRRYAEQGHQAAVWMHNYYQRLLSLGFTPQGTGVMADCLIWDKPYPPPELPEMPQGVPTELPTFEGRWHDVP